MWEVAATFLAHPLVLLLLLLLLRARLLPSWGQHLLQLCLQTLLYRSRVDSLCVAHAAVA